MRHIQNNINYKAMKSIASKIKIGGIVMLTSISMLSIKAQDVRSVGDFNGIKIGDAFNVSITQSESNTLKVNAPADVLPQIKTVVTDGILTITSEGKIKTEKPVEIIIGVKALNSLDVSGSADVKTENQLVCDKLTIESNGAGDVKMDVKANAIKTKISGAGDVNLTGSSKMLEAIVDGAGDLKASNLETEKTIAKVSGAGDAKINVTQSLDADVSGAGSIIYKGNPAERNVNITGAGSIRESKSGTGNETASGDTTKFRLGKKKYMIIGEGDNHENNVASKKDSLNDYNEEFKHWTGFEIGVNGLLDYKNSLDVTKEATFLELNYAKSYQFGLNLMETDYHIYKNFVNLNIGFGFDFNHYAFNNKVTLNPDTTFLSASTDTKKYKKNTLNVSYIKAPILLEFNTSKNSKKNLHIAAGVQFNYRIHSVAKQIFEVDDKHFRTKEKDDFNLEPFEYIAVARIGYNNVTLFANYGLTRLFKKDQGPQVYPFTVGLTINL
jgi:hypothetical protein